MSKKKRERALSDNEGRRWTCACRIRAQKLNLLAQLIRGKEAKTALADLEFSRKRIARDVRKCLESAIANAEKQWHVSQHRLFSSLPKLAVSARRW